MNLTEKQAKFVKAYTADPQGKKAAIKAGYSTASASVEASRLLKNKNVLAALDMARHINKQAENKIDAPNVFIGKSPLDYMLNVMNDETADDDRRDKMATAAAPYMHLKKGEGGKKDEKQEAAKSAGRGKFAPTAMPRLVVNNKN